MEAIPSNIIITDPNGAAGGVPPSTDAPPAPPPAAPPAPLPPAPPPPASGGTGGGVSNFFKEMDWVQAIVLMMTFIAGFYVIYYYRTAVIKNKSVISDQQVQINQAKNDIADLKSDKEQKDEQQMIPSVLTGFFPQ